MLQHNRRCEQFCFS